MEQRSTEGMRWGALVCGALGLVCFFGLTQTWTGLAVTFSVPPTRFGAGELYFWVAWALLVAPSGALLGWGLGRWPGRAWSYLATRLEGLGGVGRAGSWALLALAAWGLYRAGRLYYLRDLPITDDEYAARFGGQVLAAGSWLAPAPEPWAAFSPLFLYARDGLVTSFEYPGVILAWALAELTGTGAALFTVAAAATVVLLGWAARSRWEARWGAACAALYLLSPMASVMSMSSHAQVLSRASVAATLALWSWAEGDGASPLRARRWLLVGLALAVGGALRPPEVACLLLPLGLHLVWRAARRAPGAPAALGALLLGALPLLALLAAHNLAVTGSLWEMPRFAASMADLSGRSGWELLAWRFGANLSPNLLALAVTFLGPVGVGLVMLGAGAGRFERLLMAGVGLSFGLALLHDHQGLHIAGPMHYTECAAPLALVATAGLRRVAGWLEARGEPPARWLGVVAVSLVVSAAVFIPWQGQALRRSNQAQAELYALIDAAPEQPAVVLAPRFGATWGSVHRYGAVGSWVFEWRRPRMYGAEPVVIAHDSARWRAQLRQRYPERTFYRLQLSKTGELPELVPLPALRWKSPR